MNFDRACEHVIDIEGGYKVTTTPGDRGGMTCAGISRRANPDWPGWALIDSGKAPDHPGVKPLIKSQYRTRYWEPIRGDEILVPDISIVIFSCAVLSGVRVASRLAQTVLKVRRDGFIGQETIAALNSVPPMEFLLKFTLLRVGRYAAICNRDRSQTRFLLGWINRALEERG